MNMIDITNLYEMRRLSTMRRLNRKIEDQDELIDYISLKYGLSQGIKKVFKLLQSVFSLSLSLQKLGSPLLRSRLTFYPLISSLYSCSLSCWMSQEANPIRHLSPYFLKPQEDFWGVFTIQASYSSFNAADIRQKHLINVKVTIALGSMSFSSCLQ